MKTNNLKTKLYYCMALIILLINASCVKKSPQAPNIIYVLADDMGFGDIAYNDPNCKIKTPNFDMIASEGMSFTNAHTTSSVCTPTRYGILTGRYNWRSPLKESVISGEDKALIRDGRQTVASLLRDNGYNTGYIGKWHLGWDWSELPNGKGIDFTKPIELGPQQLGFEYSFGHCGSLDMPPYVYVENGIPTSSVVDTIKRANGYGFYRKGVKANNFEMEDVTPNFFRRAEKFIEQSAQKDEPFFLYLPLPSPHTPILPIKEWQGKSGLNPYADFVMMIDHYMGSLNNKLKDLGIDENTILIFTTDNGCSTTARFKVLAEKGHYPNSIYRGHKADTYDGGHRVPFLVKWPKKIAAGYKTDKLICTSDLMATCAELLDVELSDNTGEDSYSMIPLFEGREDDHKRPYAVHHSFDGRFSIREGDWKLILCAGSGGWSAPRDKKALEMGLPPMQLYNMSSDQSETTNLYPDNKEKAKELFDLLLKCIDDGRSTNGANQLNDRNMRNDGTWQQLEDLMELYKTEING